MESSQWFKEITDFSYDENKHLSELIYITESRNGTTEYIKNEIGPYNLTSKVVFPSWYIDCGLFCSIGYRNILDSILQENQLSNALQNRQSQFFKSIPDYYTVYSSKDGVNWTPERRIDYAFERTRIIN